MKRLLLTICFGMILGVGYGQNQDVELDCLILDNDKAIKNYDGKLISKDSIRFSWGKDGCCNIYYYKGHSKTANRIVKFGVGKNLTLVIDKEDFDCSHPYKVISKGEYLVLKETDELFIDAIERYIVDKNHPNGLRKELILFSGLFSKGDVIRFFQRKLKKLIREDDKFYYYSY